jgi:hypothetical protein
MGNAGDLIKQSAVDEIQPMVIYGLLYDTCLSERDIDTIIVASNRANDRLDNASLDYTGFTDVLAR